MISRWRLSCLLAICTVLAFWCSPTSAQDAVDISAAKKEGKVVWYTSTPIENANRIAKLFEAETGVKVELFRSGGSAVLSRFMQEQAAGRTVVDLLTASDPAGFAALAKKNTFVAFRPKNFDKIPDAAKDKDGRYVAQRLNLISIYARSDKVAAADLPKTWADLANPKYKGKLVMADPSFTGLQLTVVGMLSKLRGWDYYEQLKKNDIMIVSGNQQVSDNIKRGERVIAAGASDSYATDNRKEGHPIVTIFPTDGTFVIPSPSAIIRNSPNPNAAKLLAQFMLTDEVQRLFPQEGGYAARIDIGPPQGNPPLGQISVLPVDYDYIESHGGQIKKKFAEVFQ